MSPGVMLSLRGLWLFVHAVLTGGILSCILSYLLVSPPGGDEVFVYAFGHYLVAGLAVWTALVMWKCRRNSLEAGIYVFVLWAILVLGIVLLLVIGVLTGICLGLAGAMLPRYQAEIRGLMQSGAYAGALFFIALALACAGIYRFSRSSARNGAEGPARK